VAAEAAVRLLGEGVSTFSSTAGFSVFSVMAVFDFVRFRVLLVFGAVVAIVVTLVEVVAGVAGGVNICLVMVPFLDLVPLRFKLSLYINIGLYGRVARVLLVEVALIASAVEVLSRFSRIHAGFVLVGHPSLLLFFFISLHLVRMGVIFRKITPKFVLQLEFMVNKSAAPGLQLSGLFVDAIL